MTKNIAHSVQERLRAVARREGRGYQAILLLYAQERWLARLAASEQRPSFVLKGGLFLYSRSRLAARPTQDIDFASLTDQNDLADVRHAFQAVARLDLGDGVRFGVDDMTAGVIAEEAQTPGVRLRVPASIGQVRLMLTLDVGFGDAVTPAPVLQTYPTLLGPGTFELYTVTIETVMAEKFQAMVHLGERNTRLKDFYDLQRLALTEKPAAAQLRAALEQTFGRRQTSFAAATAFLAQDFSQEDHRQQLWRAFLNRTRLEAPPEIQQVVATIGALLGPVIAGTAEGHWNPERQNWEPS